MAAVRDFKTEWARHLGTALPYGAYCSIQACALRSPPVALVPRRSDAVGSQEVFESYTRYISLQELLSWEEHYSVLFSLRLARSVAG